MILFIEDDIMLSEEISEFLKENDFEVEVVGQIVQVFYFVKKFDNFIEIQLLYLLHMRMKKI